MILHRAAKDALAGHLDDAYQLLTYECAFGTSNQIARYMLTSVRRTLDFYLQNQPQCVVSCFEAPREQLSLHEIAGRVFERFGYKPNAESLEILARSDHSIGENVLLQVPSIHPSPALYQLAPEARIRYAKPIWRTVGAYS